MEYDLLPAPTLTGEKIHLDPLVRFVSLQASLSAQGRRVASRGGVLPECGCWCKLTAMRPVKVGKFAPVTLRHMRSQGCRDLLVNCNSGRCNHSTIMNVGHLPDDTPIKSLGDDFVCTQCGHLGADVVPNWPERTKSQVWDVIRLSIRPDRGS